MKNKVLILILVFLLLTNIAYARTGHISLLSAQVNNDTVIGGAMADLDLEIKPGSGRVFFESFPLSKMDTQISTRFAKQFACDFLDMDCSNLDFFYTISTDGSTIGGPSAGGAMTALTIAVLDNVPVRQDVTMTGTINSGGIIGPVGSVKEKISVANKSGFTKVLIPKWGIINQNNFTLQTINKSKSDYNSINILNNYNLDSIEVIKVNHITEALYQITGKNYSSQISFNIPEKYSTLMDSFSVLLCSKSNDLQEDANLHFSEFDYNLNFNILESLYDKLKENYTNETYNEYSNLQLKIRAYNQYNNSREALRYNKSYSAASFCFVTNTLLRELILTENSEFSINTSIENTQIELNNLKSKTESQDIDSIIALQTKQIVLERLFDAQDNLDIAKKENDSSSLAYAIERIYSAEIWYNFFNIETRSEPIDESTLLNLCRLKIMEAQERITFLASETAYEFPELDKDLSEAIKLNKNGNYELCIQIAAQTKAQADLLMTGYHLYDVNKTDLFNEKYLIVKNMLAKEISQNVFPISALSYFEYAESLKDKDLGSALLYLEYASELSNLDMYFSKGKKVDILLFYLEDDNVTLLIFSFALILVGILMFFLILGYVLFLKFKIKK